jgi:transcriptional regulator with XRE-family HTH domain
MTSADIPQIICHAREVAGLTRKELDTVLRLPRGYLHAVENGRIMPGRKTLTRLFSLFQLGTIPDDTPDVDIQLGEHRMTYSELQALVNRVAARSPHAAAGIVEAHRTWCRMNNEEALL